MKVKSQLSDLDFSSFSNTEQRFLNIAQPLIMQHLDYLLSEVSNKYGRFIEMSDLKLHYLRLISEKVILFVSRAAVLELRLARQLGELSGVTPEERFDSFFIKLNTSTFLKQYPVLHRLLDSTKELTMQTKYGAQKKSFVGFTKPKIICK